MAKIEGLVLVNEGDRFAGGRLTAKGALEINNHRLNVHLVKKEMY
jgi:hypothetical protein